MELHKLMLLDIKYPSLEKNKGFLKFIFAINKELIYNPGMKGHTRKWQRLQKELEQVGPILVGGIKLKGNSVLQESWIYAIRRPNEVFQGITQL